MESIKAHLRKSESITCRDDSCRNVEDPGGTSPPMRIHVLHCDPRLTGAALDAAEKMAAGLRAEVVLLAVREIPYPLPMDRPDFRPELYLDQLKDIAGDLSCPLRIELILAREKTDALCQFLHPGSLVMVATRRHWWRTSEEKLARRLMQMGCNVSLLTLRMNRTGLVSHRFSPPAQAGDHDAVPREVSHA